MDTHNVYRGIVWVVVGENRFDVKESAADLQPKVVMESVLAPMGTSLTDLIDRATGHKEMKHLFRYRPGCEPFEVLLNPLARDRFPRDVAGELPLA
jgi:hypothetical protein